MLPLVVHAVQRRRLTLHRRAPNTVGGLRHAASALLSMRAVATSMPATRTLTAPLTLGFGRSTTATGALAMAEVHPVM
jgi:hypothetical protein